MNGETVSDVTNDSSPIAEWRLLIAKYNDIIYTTVASHSPVPAFARSKAWVCGRSSAEIVGLNPTGGMDSVCCECCVLSGRSLCDKPITRPEKSYRLWCVVMCDLETSKMRKPWPTGRMSRPKKKKKKNYFAFILYIILSEHGYELYNSCYVTHCCSHLLFLCLSSVLSVCCSLTQSGFSAKQILSFFAKFRKATIVSVTCVRFCLRPHGTTQFHTERIFMKFRI
jgi:hypothetical protein